MRFKGMVPLPEAAPVVEVESNGQFFDLHNAADLDGIEIDARNAVVLIRWKIRNPLETPHVVKRATVAIVLTDVTELRFEGPVLTDDADAHQLDALWYDPRSGTNGDLRLELLGGAVLHVTAGACELRIVGQTT